MIAKELRGEYMKHDLQQIKKAKQGDTKAFAKLYQTIYPDLYRFALYTLKSPTEAEDAVSEAVIDAFSSIQKLRREESFQCWMFKILSAKCKQHFREYYKIPAELDENMIDTSLSQDMDENLWVRHQFFQLEDEDRLIISMHLFAGYTSREIGEILHINENTVRSKESRALKKMALQMKGER